MRLKLAGTGDKGVCREAMTENRADWLVGALLAAGLAVCASAQGPTVTPQLAILSPESEAYVSGLTRLRATVDPPDAASAVSWRQPPPI